MAAKILLVAMILTQVVAFASLNFGYNGQFRRKLISHRPLVSIKTPAGNASRIYGPNNTVLVPCSYCFGHGKDPLCKLGCSRWLKISTTPKALPVIQFESPKYSPYSMNIVNEKQGRKKRNREIFQRSDLPGEKDKGSNASNKNMLHIVVIFVVAATALIVLIVILLRVKRSTKKSTFKRKVTGLNGLSGPTHSGNPFAVAVVHEV